MEHKISNEVQEKYTLTELQELGKQIKLNNKWSFYYHAKNNTKLYNDNTTKIYDIDNIADFWGTYNNIPTPSNFFYDGINYKKIKRTNETPASYSFFKNDIYPAWEEPSNVNGFEFSIKYYSVTNIDNIWLNYLLNIINNNYEYIDYLNGIRIVDCSNYSKTIYRIELWYLDLAYKNKIEKDLKKYFNISYNTKILYREHKILKEK